jgi:hypothetical protein
MCAKYKTFLHFIPGQTLCRSCRKNLPLWLNEQKETKVCEDENNCESEEENQQDEEVQYDTVHDTNANHDW